ncbi:hypothetical protein GHR37_19255 [Achromobacter xylosoxidans]|nr:hypothetical protein [Achromobacter xylosoxidans]
MVERAGDRAEANIIEMLTAQPAAANACADIFANQRNEAICEIGDLKAQTAQLTAKVEVVQTSGRGRLDKPIGAAFILSACVTSMLSLGSKTGSLSSVWPATVEESTIRLAGCAGTAQHRIHVFSV